MFYLNTGLEEAPMVYRRYGENPLRINLDNTIVDYAPQCVVVEKANVVDVSPWGFLGKGYEAFTLGLPIMITDPTVPARITVELTTFKGPKRIDFWLSDPKYIRDRFRVKFLGAEWDPRRQCWYAQAPKGETIVLGCELANPETDALYEVHQILEYGKPKFWANPNGPEQGLTLTVPVDPVPTPAVHVTFSHSDGDWVHTWDEVVVIGEGPRIEAAPGKPEQVSDQRIEQLVEEFAAFRNAVNVQLDDINQTIAVKLRGR